MRSSFIKRQCGFMVKMKALTLTVISYVALNRFIDLSDHLFAQLTNEYHHKTCPRIVVRIKWGGFCNFCKTLRIVPGGK